MSDTDLGELQRHYSDTHHAHEVDRMDESVDDRIMQRNEPGTRSVATDLETTVAAVPDVARPVAKLLAEPDRVAAWPVDAGPPTSTGHGGAPGGAYELVGFAPRSVSNGRLMQTRYMHNLKQVQRTRACVGQLRGRAS